MQKKFVLRSAIRLFFLFFLVNTISYIGGTYMTPETMQWYYTLPMSSLTPPDWVFPIVWMVLFSLMALSAFLVWGKVTPRWFTAQLMANMLWSFTFFYLRNPVLAVGVIILMLVFLFLNIYTFGKVSRVAAWMLIPTFLWALFALYLNLYIVIS